MSEMAGGVMFADTLDGASRLNWRTPPAHFVDVPKHGRAYYLNWQRRTGGFPVVGDESWSEYVVDVEVRPTSREGYLGLSFHLSDDGKRACNVHFPVAGSGWSEAFQSMGIWGEICAWKLYPESQGYAIFPRDQWLGLRLVVARRSAELFVHGAPRPALIFPELPFERGGVGLWSFGGSGYFRGLTISELAAPRISALLGYNPWNIYAAADVLRTWDVVPHSGGALPADLFARGDKTWKFDADFRGVVNLSPLALEVPALRQVAARATVASSERRTARCAFTYTDHASVWCGGRVVFDGPRRGWNDPNREKHFGGRLIPDEFDIALPLEAGENEVVVVSERTEPWGWGFWVRLVED